MTKGYGDDDDRPFVTALARGLEILGCFSASRPEIGGSQLAALTGLPQPTVWRLCHTMVQLGFLVAVSG
ncbi:MAG: helix-turn-helix domain-containing protein, partial [Pseudomonadota bacterium]|nr:helix-turn-helix domain-containing protein [Pseudomonadota bacterium]